MGLAPFYFVRQQNFSIAFSKGEERKMNILLSLFSILLTVTFSASLKFSVQTSDEFSAYLKDTTKRVQNKVITTSLLR